jgi:CO/xanthine dehydrogenase Mo-binding subunit
VTASGRGRGIAFGVTDPGAPLASTATVHVLSDGSVVLLAGTIECGQGARTVMSQIVAEELAVPLKCVTMRATDTAYTPFDRSTAEPLRPSWESGAARGAGRAPQLLDLAAEQFEAPLEAITLQDGTAAAGNKIALRHSPPLRDGEERSSAAATRTAAWRRPRTRSSGRSASARSKWRWTGRRERSSSEIYSAADAGKSAAPDSVRGLDEASAMMGVGHTLQSIIYDGG